MIITLMQSRLKINDHHIRLTQFDKSFKNNGHLKVIELTTNKISLDQNNLMNNCEKNLVESKSFDV